MIQYTLRCDKDHRFDSWFQSAAAFDALEKAGHLSCAYCGSGDVQKAVMAPRVSTADTAPEPEAPVPVLAKPEGEVAKALADLRRKVEENSDYVGTDFATEARAMHEGETPERSIYGEARPDEAKALIDEGVPVLPLPFRPKRRTQ